MFLVSFSKQKIEILVSKVFKILQPKSMGNIVNIYKRKPSPSRDQAHAGHSWVIDKQNFC